jgi:hypothetical protein
MKDAESGCGLGGWQGLDTWMIHGHSTEGLGSIQESWWILWTAHPWSLTDESTVYGQSEQTSRSWTLARNSRGLESLQIARAILEALSILLEGENLAPLQNCKKTRYCGHLFSHPCHGQHRWHLGRGSASCRWKDMDIGVKKGQQLRLGMQDRVLGEYDESHGWTMGGWNEGIW